jgi:hypothetical protein
MRCFVLAMVAALPLSAQVKGPSDVTVAAGKLVAVPLTVDGEDFTYAVLGGDAFGAFREFSPANELKLQVLGYQAGSGYLVVSSTKGGKLQPLYVVAVKVTGPGPAPAPPNPAPPGPVPPAPEDPAVAKLRAAAATDGIGAAGLRALAGGFRVAAALAPQRETAGELQTALGVAIRKDTPKKPAAVWAMLQKELDKLEATADSARPERTLTESDRGAAAALFLALSSLCESAAK